MIRFERATPADAEVLTAVQVRTFDDDSRRFLNKPRGGPPGYDSVQWQRMIMQRAAAYYKIVADDVVIGGMIVFNMGGGHYELGRIYLDPAHQDRGIGQQAMRFVEQAHPQAKRWTLDTPLWATRNHYFYEKLGYRRVRETPEFVYYEKVIGAERAENLSR